MEDRLSKSSWCVNNEGSKQLYSLAHNYITWKIQGSNCWFELKYGEFKELGFSSGNEVTVSYDFLAAPDELIKQSFTFIIKHINANRMHVTQEFGLNPNTGGETFKHIDGRKFPTYDYVGEITFEHDKQQ